jgi:hypothetical protein
MAYLDNLAELNHEDREEDDDDLAIHDHELPEEGLRQAVAAV